MVQERGLAVTRKEPARLHKALRWQEGSKKMVAVCGGRALDLMGLTEQAGCGSGADGQQGNYGDVEVMRGGP